MGGILHLARDQVFQFSNIATIDIGDGVTENFAQKSHRDLQKSFYLLCAFLSH
jgi:hypothetical protein